MKKIFTLVFFLGIISISFAQSGNGNYPDNRDSRRVILGQPTNQGQVYNDQGRSMNSTGQRERMIQQINQRFDYKIRQVQLDRSLKNGQKKREIRSLEQQRAEKLQQVNTRFTNNSSNRNYDEDRNYSDRNRNNNQRN
jgi:hypothetical protein